MDDHDEHDDRHGCNKRKGAGAQPTESEPARLHSGQRAVIEVPIAQAAEIPKLAVEIITEEEYLRAQHQYINVAVSQAPMPEKYSTLTSVIGCDLNKSDQCPMDGTMKVKDASIPTKPLKDMKDIDGRGAHAQCHNCPETSDRVRGRGLSLVNGSKPWRYSV